MRESHVVSRNPSFVRTNGGDTVHSMSCHPRRVRLLVVPGLYGSDPAHWQSWLQSLFRGAQRVEQDDWAVPDLAAWSARIGEVVASDPTARWIGVAHSFGCLALAHCLQRRHASGEARAQGGIGGALFVAPAEPNRFRVADLLPQTALNVPSVVLASQTDPWIRLERAAEWAERWNSGFSNLGDAGHINTAAGFGPLPIAKRVTEVLMRRASRRSTLTLPMPLLFPEARSTSAAAASAQFEPAV